jgi:hypothetical protein
MKNWIVISGRLLDTIRGGGFEFLGPFTQEEAERYVEIIKQHVVVGGDVMAIAVELLRVDLDVADSSLLGLKSLRSKVDETG